MENVTAVISMLHEPASPSSATRLFRQEPVLAWTLQRLWMAKQLSSAAILCWDDQLEDIKPLAEEYDAHILVKTPRTQIATMESVTAARRWADGWRGGLLYTCDFDLGFHGKWLCEIIEEVKSDAVLLIDPAAGLIDPKLIDAVIDHATKKPHVEILFTQAACGLAPVLLRPAFIARLADAQTHPGRVLHYLPDQPMRDPISGEGCVPVPTSVARTTRNFKLDSDRQIQRLTDAAIDLNGELVHSDAEDLLHRLSWTADVDAMPREIVLELNTDRDTRPIFWPGKFHKIKRPPMPLEMAQKILSQISASDVRLTLAGVGDPLLHENFFEIIDAARQAGITAIHVETDLLSGDIERLVETEIDIVSMHLPAMTPPTYANIMGVNRFRDAIENIRRFIVHRNSRGRGVPILTPLFAKCQANLAEMEAWYDQWLKALGAAVINGPSDFAGLILDCGVADMSPPKRRPCNRLWSRMKIHSDGKVVSCEQDVTARQIVGDVSSQSLDEIWNSGFKQIRGQHRKGYLDGLSACAGCREWHRP